MSALGGGAAKPELTAEEGEGAAESSGSGEADSGGMSATGGGAAIVVGKGGERGGGRGIRSLPSLGKGLGGVGKWSYGPPAMRTRSTSLPGNTHGKGVTSKK